MGQAAHGIAGGIRRGGGAGQATSGDDGGSALLHGFDEVTLQPFVITDDVRGGLAIDLGIEEIRILCGAVIAPDGQVADAAGEHASLGGELALGAIFIQAGHGEPAVGGNALRAVHGDQAVRVAGIPHHKHAHVTGRIFFDRLALAGEDFAVDAQQVFALHARFARNGTDKDGPVRAGEAFVDVGGGGDAVQQGEGTVIEFHADPA